MAATEHLEHYGQEDVYIAPLKLGAKQANKRASVVNFQRPQPYIPVNTVTPPLTPQTSDEELNTMVPTPVQQPHFSEYWRAFYGYYPTYDEQSATITLPLNAGDLVLVHSIHDNGWADGTLLNSGIRGWFPTNYCEPYDHEFIRNLLRALTNFFDIVRAGADGNVSVFCNQDYMRGLVAGVRFLLEKTGCLGREAAMVVSRLSLSRNRKALLSDLSALVKIAKALQTELTATHAQPELDGATIDDMVLRAFKLVLRAVKFHDVWLQTVMDEDSVDGPGSPLRPSSAARSHRGSRRDSAQSHSPSQSTSADTHTVTRQDAGNDLDSPRTNTSNQRRSRQTSLLLSRPQTSLSSRPSSVIQTPSTTTSNRLSARFSHRISYASKLEGICRENLASERLTKCHDSLLTSLGSFIGIHLSSRTSQELVAATQDCLDGAQKLVDLLRAIWDRGYYGSENIHDIAETMFGKIAALVDSVQNVFDSLREPGEEFGMADRRQMTDSATACIRAAGEVVSKGRYVLEMIGDFEFEADGPREPEGAFEGTDLVSREESSSSAQPSSAEQPPVSVRRASRPVSVSQAPPQPNYDAPAPPLSSSITPNALRIDTGTTMDQHNNNDMTPPADRISNGSWLPPLPRFTSPMIGNSESHGFLEVGEAPHSARSDSLRNASVMSGSTFAGSKRDSEQSSLSLTSTRATSPDGLDKSPEHSQEAATADATADERIAEEEAEVAVLEKTFAHELVFNKEGQVTGGTLPALVERLTTSDSTPDALFVSTFYLTFRLFASPLDFAQALIDRFDYVSENKTSTPVQLRVYNILKGWLESHWRCETDLPALEPITGFANGPLSAALPSAGKHLAELADKINNVSPNAPLVPRLVSSLGKTNISLASYVPADAPKPSPVFTRSQASILRAWKDGGKSQPSILDFEPLELARQFTLKVGHVFCSIMPEELLATEWTKKSGSVAVNVRQLSTLSTDLANLVADSILVLEDPGKRAKTIKQWVKIAKACQDLQNYDSLIAIVCSLNSTTILRLKRTWDVISAKTKSTLASLNGIVDCSRNYSALRAQLTQAAPPCIPFVGMYLTDLTFVDAGNPNTRTLDVDVNGQAITAINFDKHVKTARIISDLQRFQLPYRLQEVPELQVWMQDQLTRVRSSEQGMGSTNYYRRSLMLEPRETKSAQNSPSLGGFSPVEATPKERWGMMLKGALGRTGGDSRRPSLTGTE